MPDSTPDIFLQWKPPEVSRDTAFEEGLLRFWRSGDLPPLLADTLRPDTLNALHEAATNLRQAQASAGLFADTVFQAAPAPMLIVKPAHSTANRKLQTLLQRDALRQNQFALTERMSALQPITRLVRSSPRISRKTLVIALDNTAYSATLLVAPGDDAVIVYLRALDLELSWLPPTLQMRVLLHFSGFKAKEIAFVMQCSVNTVHRQSQLHKKHLHELYRQVYAQNPTSHA